MASIVHYSIPNFPFHRLFLFLHLLGSLVFLFCFASIYKFRLHGNAYPWEYSLSLTFAMGPRHTAAITIFSY